MKEAARKKSAMVFLGGQMERVIMASSSRIKDTGKVNKNGPMARLMLENFKTMYEKVMGYTRGSMARYKLIQCE
jgi:hypothetical protein